MNYDKIYKYYDRIAKERFGGFATKEDALKIMSKDTGYPLASVSKWHENKEIPPFAQIVLHQLLGKFAE